MTGSIVAARYGEAVFALAKEKEKIEPWLEQLQEIADLVEANAELRELLQSGMIEKKQKKELLQKIFAPKIDDEILHLLLLLVDKDRQMALPDIVQAYRERVDDYNDIKVADVKSAVPLDSATAERLREALEKRLSCRIRLEITIDPAILGGLKVQIGDTVYDGSLAHQLTEMGRQLVK